MVHVGKYTHPMNPIGDAKFAQELLPTSLLRSDLDEDHLPLAGDVMLKST